MKFLIAGLICLTLNSCTLSLQNISTHGTASDLVDEALSTTPTVTEDLPINP